MADIQVQICYATPNVQIVRSVLVPVGSSLQAAIERSGVPGMVPEIDLEACRVGVYGKLKTLDAILREGDRVEIYRPLVADPKDSRRKRAVKKVEKKAR